MKKVLIPDIIRLNFNAIAMSGNENCETSDKIIYLQTQYIKNILFHIQYNAVHKNDKSMVMDSVEMDF